MIIMFFSSLFLTLTRIYIIIIIHIIHNLYDIQKTYTKEFNMSTVYVTSILALDPWPG